MNRVKEIGNILLEEQRPLSISEIHNYLFDRQGIDVTRKTIQRDIEDMEERGIIAKLNSYPAKYQLTDSEVLHIELSLEEIGIMINALEQLIKHGPNEKLLALIRKYKNYRP